VSEEAIGCREAFSERKRWIRPYCSPERVKTVPDTFDLAGYIAPADKLAGRGPAILADRDRKLEAARERREQVRATTRATG